MRRFSLFQRRARDLFTDRHLPAPIAMNQTIAARHRFATLVLGLALTMMACASTVGPGASTTPAPSTTLQVYFAHHPETDAVPNQVMAVTRAVATPMPTTQARATFALQQLFAGPTTAERASGFYSPFDGKLALISNCPGDFRDFDLLFNQRASTTEPGTVTVQLCRRVDIAGDLDGPRMAAMLSTTLLQFTDIKQVVILNNVGGCFADLSGLNTCLGGTSTGYPVDVYFSRHPESDSRPGAVFAVHRIAPTLGVATYAIAQLIAGPTPTESANGYFTPLSDAFSGDSSCGPNGFVITLNMHGQTPEVGTATLQFCRTMRGLGDIPSGTAYSEIVNTLRQFPSIKEVFIYNKDGSCFDTLISIC